MTTIHVVIAEKQYSSSKVLAAFDDAEAAGKLKDIIEATEPRWTITVQPIELQRAGLPIMGTAKMGPLRPLAEFEVMESKEPLVNWQVAPEVRYEVDAQGRSARIHGGPVKGTPFYPESADPHYSPPEADNPNGMEGP